VTGRHGHGGTAVFVRLASASSGVRKMPIRGDTAATAPAATETPGKRTARNIGQFYVHLG